MHVVPMRYTVPLPFLALPEAPPDRLKLVARACEKPPVACETRRFSYLDEFVGWGKSQLAQYNPTEMIQGGRGSSRVTPARMIVY